MTELWLPVFQVETVLPKYIRVSKFEGDFLLTLNCQRELKEEDELDARDLLVSRELEYKAELWAL